MTDPFKDLEEARRFLAIDWTQVARRRANKKRLAEGRPPWNFVCDRPVPPVIPPAA